MQQATGSGSGTSDGGRRCNFVIRATAAELRALAAIDDVDAHAMASWAFMEAVLSRPDYHWCLLTYLRMRSVPGLRVSLSAGLEAGTINIAHSEHLRTLRPVRGAYVVCIRADFPRRLWADFHVVQNRLQEGQRAHCIFLWPQPGCIAPASPRAAIRTAGYIGETTNGNLAWTARDWTRLLAPQGIRFVVPDRRQWHDLSAFDLVIAIRSFSQQPYPGKPPSKLVNAWLAGVPFIGGADSAYAQVGTPGVDYLRATTPDEVVAAVQRLRAEPDLRHALIRNGRRQAAGYAVAATTRRWHDLLTGPVLDDFRRRQRAPAWWWLRTRLLWQADRVRVPLRRMARALYDRAHAWRDGLGG